jgi:hypothetical protein
VRWGPWVGALAAAILSLHEAGAVRAQPRDKDAWGRPALAAPCSLPPTLPAYSHNDYLQDGPLEDALRLGYAGVEVDLQYAHGRLLVAHDRELARLERTFDRLYLEPLASRLQRCGAILPSGRPFLLFIDLKSNAMSAYQALRAALAARRDLFTVVRDGTEHPGPVTVVLVGWLPPLDSLRVEPERRVSIQVSLGYRPSNRDTALVGEPAHLVRLVSLDASDLLLRMETIPPSRLPTPSWVERLRMLAKVRGYVPGRLARIHHLRVHPKLYAAVRARGVDLIGTFELESCAAVLAGRHPVESDATPAKH